MSANLTIQMDPSGEIQLLVLSAEGDQAAFEQLVKRYQGLVCSLAYSAFGNQARSEDLAQEVFVAAWTKLKSLRDQSQFKSWLCGIARNLINQSIRQQGRNPAASASTLDVVSETAASDSSPAEEAIRAEEESLVWQALERMPENYREPMVLFYREHQSIDRVAERLELAPDTVKQRLSRGRKLLQEEVFEQVESTLTRSRPTARFTAAVLAALPLATTKAAAAGVMGSAGVGAQGTMAAKSAGVGLGGWLLAPLMKLGLAGLLVKLQLDASRSPRERRFVVRMLLVAVVWLALYIAAIFGANPLGIELLADSPSRPAIFLAAFLVPWILISRWAGQRIRQIRIEDGAAVEGVPARHGSADSQSRVGRNTDLAE